MGNIKFYLIGASLLLAASCQQSPGSRAVNLNSMSYRLADDSSKVYWQCPVQNYSTGTMTACIEPSVQVMEEQNIEACKKQWGEAWVSHWIPANGAEWVSPPSQGTAILRPGESIVIHGEIPLPEKYHNKKLRIINQTACSAEASVSGH